MNEYDGKQFVGIDLHRQRSVIVRQSESGEQLSAVRIVNDPVALGLQIEDAGADPEVVLEATYGWYWAVDVLQAHGAQVHLATSWEHRRGCRGGRVARRRGGRRSCPPRSAHPSVARPTPPPVCACAARTRRGTSGRWMR
jgi:hypothetical protein